MSAQPLDLSQPRDLGVLLSTTFSLYSRHFRLFASLALGTVFFVDLVVFGIGAGWLWSGYDSDYPVALDVIDSLIPVLVLTPLVTATHVQAVAALGSGRVPAVSEAMQSGLSVFPRTLWVVVLYTLGSFGGLLLLIAPGVYLFAAWFVAVPAAVIEGRSGPAALGRSRELVEGRWWRVFGIAAFICVLPALVGYPAFAGIRALADSADSMAVFLAGRIVIDAAFYSFTALAGTLLYFDLRVRSSLTVAPIREPRTQ